MFKKTGFVILTISLFVSFLPLSVFASGMSREYTPPIGSDYYQKKMSYQLLVSHGVEKLRMIQYETGVPISNETVMGEVVWDVEPNKYVWIDMFCAGPMQFEYLDEKGEVVDRHTRGEGGTYLQEGVCKKDDFVAPSDFNEEKNQYKSDTFGGEKEQLDKPEKADGSGGSGDTAYKGDKGDSEGEGGGDSGGGETCEGCGVLACPGWEEYMGKIDDIKNAIPSAPDWDKVADTFKDKIAPQIKNDLENVLGKAPSKPKAPDQPGGIDDKGFADKTPEGKESPGLGDIDFGSVKDEAPEIHENKDETPGFEINNPIDSFPSQDEFKENTPEDKDNPAPDPPKDNSSDAPVPNDPEGEAPMPEDNGGNAPVPDDQEGEAPMPEDNGGNAPVPDDQEGEAPMPEDNGGNAPIPEDGGNNAPIPGDGSGSAPIPGDGGGNAPIPGGGSGNAPIPGDGGWNPPIPDKGNEKFPIP